MIRTLAFGGLVGAVVIACVSVAPSSSVVPSAAPTARASVSVTTAAPATANATVAASASPTASPPTASPTATPSTTLSPTATPAITDAPSPQSTGSAAPPASFDADLANLIARVPDHLRGDCGEIMSFDGGFLYGIQCINLPGIDGYVTYYQFDTIENLNASYESNREYFAPGVTGTDCSSGPSESGYTVAGTETGRVFCADYDNGQILTWTSEPLNIESTIVLYGGSYADLNDVWQNAGPLLDAAPSSPSADTVDWTTSAGAHRDAMGQTFTYTCPSNGSEYTVYGTDVYTDDSSVCTAAVHAGLITFAAGGSVTFKIVEGQDSYIGSERNGVISNNWGSWDVSFIFLSP